MDNITGRQAAAQHCGAGVKQGKPSYKWHDEGPIHFLALEGDQVAASPAQGGPHSKISVDLIDILYRSCIHLHYSIRNKIFVFVEKNKCV